MYKRLIAIVIILGMFSSLFSSSISNVKGYSSLADFVNSIKPATSSSSFSDGNFYAYLKVANGKNVLFAWVKGSGSIYVYEYSNNAWTVKSTINGVLPGSEQTQILSYPVKLSSNSSGSLTVTITGNDFVNIGDIESYSINISGGTPPYNVSWTCNRSNPSSGSATVPSAFSVSLLFSSYGDGTINVNVTDSVGSSASASFDLVVLYISWYDSGKGGVLYAFYTDNYVTRVNTLGDPKQFYVVIGGNVTPSSVILNNMSFSFSSVFVVCDRPTYTVNGVSFSVTKYRLAVNLSLEQYINLGQNTISITFTSPSGKSKSYSFNFIGNVYLLPIYYVHWMVPVVVEVTQYVIPVFVATPDGKWYRVDIPADPVKDKNFGDFYFSNEGFKRTAQAIDLVKQGGGQRLSKAPTMGEMNANLESVVNSKGQYVAAGFGRVIWDNNKAIIQTCMQTVTYTEVYYEPVWYDTYADFVAFAPFYPGSPFTVTSPSGSDAVEAIVNPGDLSGVVPYQYIRVSSPTKIVFDYVGKGGIDVKKAGLASYGVRTIREPPTNLYPENLSNVKRIITLSGTTLAMYNSFNSLLITPSFAFTDQVVVDTWVEPSSLTVNVSGPVHVSVVGLLTDNTYLYPQVNARDTADYSIVPDALVGFTFIGKKIGTFSVTFSELPKPFTMTFNVTSLSVPTVIVNDNQGSIKVSKSGTNIYGNQLYYRISYFYPNSEYWYWEYMYNNGSLVSDIVGINGGSPGYISKTLTSSAFYPGVVSVSITPGSFNGYIKVVFDFDGLHEETVVQPGSSYAKTFTLFKDTYPNEIMNLSLAYAVAKPYTLLILYSYDGQSWYTYNIYTGTVYLYHST